jgi:hypothetical protein
MAIFLQKKHLEHPFARHFLPTRQPNCYRRSGMVAAHEWKYSDF